MSSITTIAPIETIIEAIDPLVLDDGIVFFDILFDEEGSMLVML